MPKREAPLHTLNEFLPDGSSGRVITFLNHYKVHLTITRARNTILGDYRHAVDGKNHRISVNGNLNRFAFLVTLLHELAHLLTYMTHGNRVASHGREWKLHFSYLLRDFLQAGIFPHDIKEALKKSYHNPAASSCADDQLVRVLRRYDIHPPGKRLIEELETGALFSISRGRVFKKGERVRKRFQCVEVKTGRIYLFSPVHEVELLENTG